MHLKRQQSGWRNMMAKLAVCVVTHDYVEALKDVLLQNLPIFNKYEMDVIVLNSSQKIDDTDAFINSIRVSYDRIEITHVHVPEAVRLEEKMQLLFKGYPLKKEYDYVWPIGHRRVVSDELCGEISSQISEGCDFLTIFNGANKVERIKDKNEYFVRCAEQSIMLGAAIYRQSLIERLKIDDLYIKYSTNDPTTFYQMSVYFEGISIKEKFEGVVISAENAITLSKTNATKYWESARFLTWAETFPPFVLGLPDEYRDKQGFINRIQRDKFNLSVRAAVE